MLLTPPQPQHDQPRGLCSFPGAGPLLCLSAIVLIPVLPHLLQAGPHRCLILPSTGCRAGRLPLGLTGSSCAQNSHYGCVGTPGLTRTGLGTAHCHGHARRPLLPSSAHPLTRAWVVGKGCRSRGFGSLGIRSSGSTLTCERQEVRHNQAEPRLPRHRCWCPVCRSCTAPAAPGQAPAGKPRLKAPSQREITGQHFCKHGHGPHRSSGALWRAGTGTAGRWGARGL